MAEDQEAPVESYDTKGIFKAVKQGNAKLLREKLKHPSGLVVNVDKVKDRNGLPVVCAAATFLNTDVMQVLVDCKADLNVHDTKGRMTPLQTACQAQALDMVKLLLDNGAELNATDAGGQTALIHASWRGDNKSLEFLLTLDAADTRHRDKSGRTALMGAAGNDKLVCIGHLLQRDPECINLTDNAGLTALMHAARLGRAAVVKVLLTKKASVDELDTRNLSALGWAARAGSLPIVKSLVEQGNADVSKGSPPLVFAANKGHDAICKYLLSHKADIETSVGRGWTTAMCAARQGHLETLKMLQKEGADLFARDHDKWTLLIHALHTGAVEVTKYLLEQGIDPNAKSALGTTALHAAARVGNKEHVECAKVLISSVKKGQHMPLKKFLKFNSMPGGHLKFSIIYDDVSKLFWTPANPGTRYRDRRFLMLLYSLDGKNWMQAGCIASARSLDESFMYGHSVIDGDDLVTISRTSSGADDMHNADYSTFHRIQDFRRLALPLASG